MRGCGVEIGVDTPASRKFFELLETVVLLTGFDNPVGDVHRMVWLVYWNGKSFDAARSDEAGG